MSKYLEILFRHRLRFVILLVLLPAELALACVLLFPHQTAASSLWVDTPAYVPVSATSGWNQYLTPAQNTVDALNQLRSTDSFNQALGAKLDASKTFASDSERASVLGSVSADVVIFASGSHLVVLTDTCPREPICSNVLGDTEALYHQWLIDQQASQLNVALDFWNGQLASAQAKVNKDADALNAYYNSHPGAKTSAAVNPELDQLSRNFELDKSAMSSAQQKIDDISLAQAALTHIDSTVFRVIDPPRTTGGKLNALPRKQMLIAAAAAFALGAGVLVLMAWSDRTTREPRELESILRLPVVVTVPDLRLMESADG